MNARDMAALIAGVAVVLDGVGATPHNLNVSTVGYLHHRGGDDYTRPIVNVGVSDPDEFTRAADAFGLREPVADRDGNAYRSGMWGAIPVLMYVGAAKLAEVLGDGIYCDEPADAEVTA